MPSLLRLLSLPLGLFLVLCWALPSDHFPQQQQQKVLGKQYQEPAAVATDISAPLFASLERLARLVDISYCIGNTGVRKPFECLSRCKEFPTLSLVTTWSTGILFGDSCGYIAVDHGNEQQAESDHELSISEHDKAIIVAFRGTYSITNTIVDLATMPQQYVPYPSPDDGGESPEKPSHECTNCTVHMGFLNSWRNARDVVLPELKALHEEYPSYPIHIVGHSLGGSVACLAALELKVSLGWENVVVTTYGEPRLGNYQLARFIDEAFDLDGDVRLEDRMYRRVTHSNDPVPLLPPSEWGYTSHAGEIFISKQALPQEEADVRMCVGDEDPVCSAGDGGNLQSLMQRLLQFRWTQTSLAAHMEAMSFPTRFKLWQLFFAHRDYFWRLGLCVPGGDPANWWRGVKGDEIFSSDEL